MEEHGLMALQTTEHQELLCKSEQFACEMGKMLEGKERCHWRDFLTKFLEELYTLRSPKRWSNRSSKNNC